MLVAAALKAWSVVVGGYCEVHPRHTLCLLLPPLPRLAVAPELEGLLFVLMMYMLAAMLMTAMML
jgi:hypothetical protein